MPPKAKYTKQEIIEAAVGITREKGINAVTAREVGAALGVSSRPLFTLCKSRIEDEDTRTRSRQRVYQIRQG